MQKYQNVVLDTEGNAIPSVTVGVYDAGTSNLAVIYSGNGVTPRLNPFLTTSDGGIVFYAANGRYDIHLSKTGYTFGTDLYDIQLLDVDDQIDFVDLATGGTIKLTGTTVVSITTLLKSILPVAIQNTNAAVYAGSGTPEAVVTAPVGSLFLRTNGAADSTLYIKESGAGNTGWVAVQLFTNKIKTGAFTMDAANSKAVSDANVSATTIVVLSPTNAAAATLMSGTKSLYHSATSGGVSFTVSTADAGNAAGTETFNYILYL